MSIAQIRSRKWKHKCEKFCVKSLGRKSPHEKASIIHGSFDETLCVAT